MPLLTWSDVAHLILSRYNQPFVSAVVAAIVAQLLKGLVAAMRHDGSAKTAMTGAGGMPSAHSALALALFTSVVWQQGWGSSTTGVAAIMAVIILYDAGVVRQAMQEHSRAIRLLLYRVAPEELESFTAPESLGHTARQVAAGAALGFVVGWLISWLAAAF